MSIREWDRGRKQTDGERRGIIIIYSTADRIMQGRKALRPTV